MWIEDVGINIVGKVLGSAEVHIPTSEFQLSTKRFRHDQNAAHQIMKHLRWEEVQHRKYDKNTPKMYDDITECIECIEYVE